MYEWSAIDSLRYSSNNFSTLHRNKFLELWNFHERLDFINSVSMQWFLKNLIVANEFFMYRQRYGLTSTFKIADVSEKKNKQRKGN